MIKKIFFDHTIFLHQKTGGISNYIFELNKKLNDIGSLSRIFAPFAINDRFKIKDKNVINFVRLNSVPLFCTKIFYLINNILSLFYIYLNKPNIIHLSYYNNFLVKFIKTPYILTVYDLIHEKLNIRQTNFKKKYLIKNADKIICISRQTKNDLVKIYKVRKKKIKVIYLGVNDIKKKIYQKKKILSFLLEIEGDTKILINLYWHLVNQNF